MVGLVVKTLARVLSSNSGWKTKMFISKIPVGIAGCHSHEMLRIGGPLYNCINVYSGQERQSHVRKI